VRRWLHPRVVYRSESTSTGCCTKLPVPPTGPGPPAAGNRDRSASWWRIAPSALVVGTSPICPRRCEAVASNFYWWLMGLWSRKWWAGTCRARRRKIASDLVSGPALRELLARQSGFGRPAAPPLILHADTTGQRDESARTLEARLEERGVLTRSFSRPGFPTTTTYSESLFRTIQVPLPTTPTGHSPTRNEAASEVSAFVDWYKHRPPPQRHQSLVTPHQRHSGIATAICSAARRCLPRKSPSDPSKTLEPIPRAVGVQPEEV